MKAKKVSIIIRTKNEERWITHCLEEVYSQSISDFEVIIVDNNSIDGTLKKASQYPVKIVNIDKYKPGKALNFGISNSKGEYLVFLSGHCIPVDNQWLSNLIKGLEDESIAGVYGRQMPMSFSSPEDKRDLLITFGLDRHINIKDSFFHNANSAIKREVWEKIPFDEDVLNIEDRIWANNVIKRGFKTLYESTAVVYHHHGIHHSNDLRRAETTVQVIEKIQGEMSYKIGKMDPQKMRIISLIPYIGELIKYNGEPTLKSTLDYSFQNKLINQTIVLTDNEEVASYASEYGATVPFLRDPEYSKEYVDLSMVYSHYLEALESKGIFADLIVSLEPSYIWRPPNMLNEIISLLLEMGFDSVVPVIRDYNLAWLEKEGIRMRVDAGNIPRPLKNPLLISVKGLGFVTHPECIRTGNLIGSKCGLFEVKKKYAIEIENLEY